MAAQKTEAVNLDTLDTQQLSQVKKQIEGELDHLGTSFAQLHAAQAKFMECLRCVEARSETSADIQSVLVPLTNSLYVRGEIPRGDRVIVDIGTGYLVEKAASEAKDFYKSRSDELSKTLQELEAILQRKTANAQVVDEVIRKKILQSSQ